MHDTDIARINIFIPCKSQTITNSNHSINNAHKQLLIGWVRAFKGQANALRYGKTRWVARMSPPSAGPRSCMTPNSFKCISGETLKNTNGFCVPPKRNGPALIAITREWRTRLGARQDLTRWWRWTTNWLSIDRNERKDSESALTCWCHLLHLDALCDDIIGTNNMAIFFHQSVASSLVSKETILWVSKFCIQFCLKSIKLLNNFPFLIHKHRCVHLLSQISIHHLVIDNVIHLRDVIKFHPILPINSKFPSLLSNNLMPIPLQKAISPLNPTIPHKTSYLQRLQSIWNFATFFSLGITDKRVYPFNTLHHWQ